MHSNKKLVLCTLSNAIASEPYSLWMTNVGKLPVFRLHSEAFFQWRLWFIKEETRFAFWKLHFLDVIFEVMVLFFICDQNKKKLVDVQPHGIYWTQEDHAGWRRMHVWKAVTMLQFHARLPSKVTFSLSLFFRLHTVTSNICWLPLSMQSSFLFLDEPLFLSFFSCFVLTTVLLLGPNKEIGCQC